MSALERPPADHFPFEDGPYRPAMAGRHLDPADWIEIDRTTRAQWAAKAELLDHHPDAVYSTLPGSDEACAETLALLADHLVRHYPDIYHRAGDRLVNEATGQGFDLATDHPLAVAARLVPEDLCLHQRLDRRYHLSAACVCFPNRWRLADKIGHSLAAIHTPVPRYQEALQKVVDDFFAMLHPSRPVWRLNWVLLDTDALYLPGNDCARAGPNPELNRHNAGQRVFLRVERQTFRRLPASHAVLFTIRTHVRPLGDLADHPGICRRLAAALRALPEDVATYRCVHRLGHAALPWLDCHGR